MLTQTVDLTQLCAVKEIQYILLNSEEYQGNLILQDSFFRKRLIDYVLSNISHRYLTIEELTEIPKDAGEIFPKCPTDERKIIRQFLQMGMSEIVRELLDATENPSNNHQLEEVK